jgi:hypothetical protein
MSQEKHNSSNSESEFYSNTEELDLNSSDGSSYGSSYSDASSVAEEDNPAAPPAYGDEEPQAQEATPLVPTYDETTLLGEGATELGNVMRFGKATINADNIEAIVGDFLRDISFFYKENDVFVSNGERMAELAVLKHSANPTTNIAIESIRTRNIGENLLHVCVSLNRPDLFAKVALHCPDFLNQRAELLYGNALESRTPIQYLIESKNPQNVITYLNALVSEAKSADRVHQTMYPKDYSIPLTTDPLGNVTLHAGVLRHSFLHQLADALANDVLNINKEGKLSPLVVDGKTVSVSAYFSRLLEKSANNSPTNTNPHQEIQQLINQASLVTMAGTPLIRHIDTIMSWIHDDQKINDKQYVEQFIKNIPKGFSLEEWLMAPIAVGQIRPNYLYHTAIHQDKAAIIRNGINQQTHNENIFLYQIEGEQTLISEAAYALRVEKAKAAGKPTPEASVFSAPKSMTTSILQELIKAGTNLYASSNDIESASQRVALFFDVMKEKGLSVKAIAAQTQRHISEQFNVTSQNRRKNIELTLLQQEEKRLPADHVPIDKKEVDDAKSAMDEAQKARSFIVNSYKKFDSTVEQGTLLHEAYVQLRDTFKASFPQQAVQNEQQLKQLEAQGVMFGHAVGHVYHEAITSYLMQSGLLQVQEDGQSLLYFNQLLVQEYDGAPTFMLPSADGQSATIIEPFFVQCAFLYANSAVVESVAHLSRLSIDYENQLFNENKPPLISNEQKKTDASYIKQMGQLLDHLGELGFDSKERSSPRQELVKLSGELGVATTLSPSLNHEVKTEANPPPYEEKLAPKLTQQEKNLVKIIETEIATLNQTIKSATMQIQTTLQSNEQQSITEEDTLEYARSFEQIFIDHAKENPDLYPQGKTLLQNKMSFLDKDYGIKDVKSVDIKQYAGNIEALCAIHSTLEALGALKQSEISAIEQMAQAREKMAPQEHQPQGQNKRIPEMGTADVNKELEKNTSNKLGLFDKMSKFFATKAKALGLTKDGEEKAPDHKNIELP